MSQETTLYHGGEILGLDHANDIDEALLVRDQRIVNRGNLEDMRALSKGKANEVDIQGGFLLPGIVDSHPHAMHFMAYRVAAVDLLDAQCFDDIVKAIQERAKYTPKGEWIVCTPIGEPHYFIRRDHTSLKERRMPDRHVLDRAAPEHPVWVMAWGPRTPNITAFNSLGLQRLGIGPPIPDQVCSVLFEKDGAGLPTGILRGKVNNYYSDDPYWAALESQLPKLPTSGDIWELSGIGGLQEINAMGVTGLYEAHAMMPPHVEAYRQIANKGLCTARVVASVELSGYAFSTMNYSEDQVWELFDYGLSRQNLEDGNFRVDGVTLSRGGPLSQGYLRMYDPYVDAFGQMTRGKTFLSKAIEPKLIRKCLDNNIRLNMLLGGYRDGDEFLDSLRQAASVQEIAPLEWVLQHCYFTSPEQIREFKNYNFHITTSASFVYGKSQRVADKFPPSVCEDFIAMRRFVESGLNLACGSDWGPDNPWRQIALNETREDAATGCHDLLPGKNAIDRLTSLHSFTRNGAKVMHWSDIGSLMQGSMADFVVVDRNPLTASPEDLSETKVLRTVVGGKAVFDAGALQGGPMNIPTDAQTLIAESIRAGGT